MRQLREEKKNKAFSVVFPQPPPWKDRVIVPSKGRVKAVYSRGKIVGYQDPDIVFQRTYADGTIRPYRNPFIGREFAVDRLHYDYDQRGVFDSFGNRVGIANLGIPARGRVTDYKTLQVRWNKLTIDPRRFRPTGDQEIVERVIFIDREGRLRLVRTSYGRGKRYDRSKYGGRWRSWASRAMGLPDNARVTTQELQKAVLHKEFIIKEIKPIGG